MQREVEAKDDERGENAEKRLADEEEKRVKEFDCCQIRGVFQPTV